MKLSILLLTLSGALFSSFAQAEEKKPNVLFIALDDLNDWIGCLGGHPQTITPNLDRLAESGLLFTNAHCAAPACNASRTAIFTGRSPHRSGVYTNAQKLRDVLPDDVLLSKHFSNNGYWSTGSGKMLHYFIDAQSWDDYYPKRETEMPIPDTLYPETRPLNLPKAGPWQYIETDWGPLETSDEKFGGDYTVSQYVGDYLSKEHEKPFFLACGIYRPHEPWFVPAKYFEKFPLESIQLPPGYRSDDLEDVPALGQKVAHNRYFPHIQKHDQWKQGVQSYLASIHFADAMLGRVLDALEKGPNSDNTIVVLWSDHGWHLGEKEHWQKYTGWRQCTRVPLMMKVPASLSAALPEGTPVGVKCNQPASLLSLYPTLVELCGLPAMDQCDGESLLPLLKDPTLPTPPAATYLDDAKSLSLSGENWRYIRYGDGTEELYDIVNDPYEWKNLAQSAEHRDELETLKSFLPKTMVPKPPVKVKDLPSLRWVQVTEVSDVPPSKPDGNLMRLVFVNQRSMELIINRVGEDGTLETKGKVEGNAEQELKGRPGSVWAITTPDKKLVGYFRAGDRAAKGVIK
ncbi:sulfatase [Roseibacillus persicicus]|uniref:sulfatase n=1 Tax=Roseibacillus persicicus TaxID=454148 RepID=UPI00280EBC20|nr:sulfatase [Roseibacillus persicicus]MDQ8191985.1 sulfatase [Roseibacillus persicicus]